MPSTERYGLRGVLYQQNCSFAVPSRTLGTQPSKRHDVTKGHKNARSCDCDVVICVGQTFGIILVFNHHVETSLVCLPAPPAHPIQSEFGFFLGILIKRVGGWRKSASGVDNTQNNASPSNKGKSKAKHEIAEDEEEEDEEEETGSEEESSSEEVSSFSKFQGF